MSPARPNVPHITSNVGEGSGCPDPEELAKVLGPGLATRRAQRDAEPVVMVTGKSRVGWIAGCAACALLGLFVLHGCGFGVPLKQTTAVPEQAEASSTIRLGASTSSDVRAALGEPLLRSGFWRVELYRTDDKRTELGFAVVIVVPVPVGVFHEKRHGYVLVTYDTADHVSRVSTGVASEGFLAVDSEKWLVIRADQITFAVDQAGSKSRSTLLADASRLQDYLAERRRASGCTLVTACDEGQGCPDEIAVDDAGPFDPSPMTVLCAQDETCPTGTRMPDGAIDEKSFFRVPVMHAVDLAPGPHRVRVTSSVRKGGGEESFECAAGEVLYGTVHSRVDGAGWWSKGRLEATVTLSTVAPANTETYSLVLHRDGRWLVETEPGSN